MYYTSSIGVRMIYFFIRIHYNSTPLLSVVKMNEVKHRVPLRFTPLLKGISGLAFCAMGYPDRSY